MRNLLHLSAHIRLAMIESMLGFSFCIFCIEAEESRFEIAPLHFDPNGQNGFTLMHPRQTGIGFINRLSDREAAQNQIRLNGSGVALGDVDGDGFIDIYFCRLQGNNALYRNLGGWKFHQIVQKDIACSGQFSTGATLIDLDGDDDLDLIVNGIGAGTRLFENDGSGRFSEIKNSGLDLKGGAMTSAVADVDGDGDLDLYIARYRTTTIRSTGFAILRIGEKRRIRPEDKDRLEIIGGKVLEHGEADTLYLNDGKWKFVPVDWLGGRFLDERGKPLKRQPFDWGLAAMFRDMDHDGDPDLYVCNDFHSKDRIWINDGKGTFQRIDDLAIRHTSTFSMAVDFADINRDGHDDFFVADMLSLKHSRRMMQLSATEPYEIKVGIYADRPQFDRNTLHLNRGDGTYAEIADFADLRASEWTWSAVFLDVDLDGYEDLLCCTGHLFDTQDLDAERRIQDKGPFPRHLIPAKLLMFPKMQQPKLAFRNRGDLSFELSSAKWGFDQSGVAHGMALGDLDNDGDLDVVVNNLRAFAGLYRNNSSKPRIHIRLKGKAPNTAAVGARIALQSGSILQSQEVISGGRYLSSDDSSRMFAALGSRDSRSLEVHWQNGRKQKIKNVKSNMRYTIYESDESNESNESRDSDESNELRELDSNDSNDSRESNESRDLLDEDLAGKSREWFEDVSEKLAHRHIDRPFDDFHRQPLLPRKLSQMGPGVAWFDWDGNGWEDLIVGGGGGGKLAMFLNKKGNFQKHVFQNEKTNQRDQTAIVGWIDGDERCVLIGISNFEDASKAGAGVEEKLISVKSKNTNRKSIRKSNFIGSAANVSALAMGDVDGDGDLDLFVGAHCQAQTFPIADSSQLYLSSENGFERDESCQAFFQKLGLVRGASFGDFTGDGKLDLVVVSDWGGISLLINENGILKPRTKEWALAGFEGWWNGVATGDFNGDGRLDFVATNWGSNHPHKSGASLFYGDFDQDGQIDIVESYRADGGTDDFPIRHFFDLAQDLAFLPSQFSLLRDYNEATLNEILGNQIDHANQLAVASFHHRVFLNRGDHFESRILPIESQFAPGFGIAIGDVNLDRHEDIFIAQNFFAVQPFATRLDAGRGIWLAGKGDGTFEAKNAAETGIQIYGEARGAALADYDRDARLDLVVAQNGSETKLYRNQLDRRGIRVELVGKPINPQAIGAAIRIRYEEGWGPLKELNCGSGYWSLDSNVKIFARDGAERIWVRWPNGTESNLPIKSNNWTIQIIQKP